jgi:4-amino-4-deoxy-L-arabinose transferase-like glycosyltransferase
VVWFALFFRLGTLPLLQPDEGRNAEVAREMKESGAWLSPSYNGIAYLDKPAFYFKAVALSLAAFGNNETAARLPSAMFGLALLVITFAFCRRVHGTRCAVMAVIIIATMPLYVVFSRTIIFDIALAFFVSAAIFAGYRAEECEGKSQRNWYLLGALMAGLATLVKGPVGFLIPSLVLFVFHGVEGRWSVWKRFFAPLNLLVFFAVTLPWFIGLSLQHPDFPHYGLIEESFKRYTTTSFRRTQPFYFYAGIVAGLFLPWSFILPEAVVAAWKRKSSLTPADRLCLVWSVVVVIFFSLSKSKLPGYILTVTVACGILLARLIQQAMANPNGKAARITYRAAVTLAVLSFIVAVAAIVLSPRMGLLAKPMGLSVAEAEELGRHFTTPIILLFVFGGLGLLMRFRRDAGLCFVLFAIFPLLLFTLNLGAIGVMFDIKSARNLAQQFPALSPDTELAFFQCFPGGLPFYLNRTATLVTQKGDELTSNYILYRLRNDSVWPTNLVRAVDFNGWVAGRKHPVYLLADENMRAGFEKVTGIQKTNIQTLTPDYIGVYFPAP